MEKFLHEFLPSVHELMQEEALTSLTII